MKNPHSEEELRKLRAMINIQLDNARKHGFGCGLDKEVCDFEYIKKCGDLIMQVIKEREEKVELATRLVIFKQLHKKIMATKDLSEIDILEMVQKIVLSGEEKLLNK